MGGAYLVRQGAGISLPARGLPCVGGHDSLTTVVYKVQMIPVDRSDAQMSNPVTAKHISCQAPLILPVHLGSSLGSGFPAPPLHASQTLVQDESRSIDHDSCVQHLWVETAVSSGAGPKEEGDHRKGAEPKNKRAILGGIGMRAEVWV